jgi:3-phenylpropionate/trans-cinnamate dioxygenase ferredoxin reductase subunit
VIIGDGIAGHSAAKMLREGDAYSEISILTAEDFTLYNRINLKEYIIGGMSHSDLMIDEKFYNSNKVKIRLGTRVTAVEPDAHMVVTDQGIIEYDKLLIATGGAPIPLRCPGGDTKGVHYLWTIKDADAMNRDLADAKSAVVIGAGLLGIDLAQAYTARGIETHFIMRGEHWARKYMEPRASQIVEGGMREGGVQIHFGETPTGVVVRDGHARGVHTDKGNTYPADVVGVGVGLDISKDFLEGSGIETNEGILADSHLRTTVPDVYTAGDCAEYDDVLTGRREIMGNWASARVMGQNAALNMMGVEQEFAFVGFYSYTHFGLKCMLIGAPRIGADVSTVAVYNASKRIYRGITLYNGHIVGAVLINDFSGASDIKERMREREDVSANPEHVLATSTI